MKKELTETKDKMTPELLNQLFALIYKWHEDLMLIEGDEYYKQHEGIKKQLVLFLREDFSTLSTQDLLKLISMVSTYRPVAPHSFLLTCAQLVK